MANKSESQLNETREHEDVLQICRKAGLGEAVAQRQLMELLFDHVHTTASYVTRHREEAEDVAQTACIAMLQSVAAYRGDASLRYWADRIVLKTAASLYRKRARRRRLWEGFVHSLPMHTRAEEGVGTGTVRERLTELLQGMNRKQREVVVLRYVHGYTMKETAALCEIPFETARSRLKKGCEVLRSGASADPVLRDWVQEWIEQ